MARLSFLPHGSLFGMIAALVGVTTRPRELARDSIVIAGLGLRHNGVLGRRHRKISFAIMPENLIENCSIDRVWPGEVHLRRLLRAGLL